MDYLDTYVCSVKTENKQKYLDHAHQAAQVFKKCGAKSVVEAWGDNVPDGVLTSFPLAVKCEKDEVVVVGFVAWASKEAHEAGWEKVRQDPFFQGGMGHAPFDGKRMIFGSFTQVV